MSRQDEVNEPSSSRGDWEMVVYSYIHIGVCDHFSEEMPGIVVKEWDFEPVDLLPS